MKRIARTELPIGSSRGEKRHRPKSLGTTTMTMPLTPDLAGRPISLDQRPL